MSEPWPATEGRGRRRQQQHLGGVGYGMTPDVVTRHRVALLVPCPRLAPFPRPARRGSSRSRRGTSLVVGCWSREEGQQGAAGPGVGNGEEMEEEGRTRLRYRRRGAGGGRRGWGGGVREWKRWWVEGKAQTRNKTRWAGFGCPSASASGLLLYVLA
jgi:hypothetical protein